MTAPTFLECMVAVLGGCGIIGWLVFDVLDEQLIRGSAGSERRRAAAARAHAAKRKAAPPAKAFGSPGVQLPRARIHRP